MKKLAIAIALSCMTAGAFAMPTVYGTIDVSVEQASKKAANGKNLSEAHVHSNSSYLGIKGDVELNNRLSAVYQADWVVFADGDNRDFSNRTRFVGLKDKQLGTLKFGQQDTAVKPMSIPVDVFNGRAGGKLDVESIMLGETRLSNAIVYETPKITVGNGGLVITGVATTGEGRPKTSMANGSNYVASRGISGSFSTSAVYNSDAFLVGVGYDKNIPSLFAPKKAVNSEYVYGVADTVRVIGRAKVADNLVLKGLYQHSKAGSKTAANTNANSQGVVVQINKSTLNKAEGWLVGAEYTVPQTPVTVKASYSENVTDYKNDVAGVDDLKAQQIAAGVDYSFNKQVKAYGQVGQVQYKEGTKKDKVTLGGVGLEYKF